MADGEVKRQHGRQFGGYALSDIGLKIGQGKGVHGAEMVKKNEM
jgi:hypothetical protein